MEERQRDSFSEMVNSVDSEMATWSKDREKKRIEEEKKRRNAEFQKGLKNLAERIIERENDEDKTIYYMLRAFLDMAINVQDLMKDLDSINVAMGCLTDAISFLDLSVELDQQLLGETTAVNYSFFKRWKMRRQTRKAVSNVKKRMNAIVTGLMGKFQMAQVMTEAMSKGAKTLNVKMSKVTAKTSKRAAKRGTTDEIAANTARSDEYLNSIRGASSGDGSTGSAPSNNAGGNSNSGSDNWGDVL